MQEINVVTGYGYFTVDGKVIEKVQYPVGVRTVDIEGDYTEVDTIEELSAVQVFKYSGDTLITWALQQGFAADIMQHMAAFLDFANKATEASAANFRAYAAAVDLSATAETIIAKAIDLGANITEGE